MSTEFKPNIIVPLTPEQLAYIARVKASMLEAAKKAKISHDECKGGLTDKIIEEEKEAYEAGELLFEYKLSAVCPIQIQTEDFHHGPLFVFNPDTGEWQVYPEDPRFTLPKIDFKKLIGDLPSNL